MRRSVRHFLIAAPYRACIRLRSCADHHTTGTRPEYAGKRQQAILSAILAVEPQETPRQNSAIPEGTKFFFHESRDRPVTLLLSGKESFQLFRDDLIQHCRFRIARLVRDVDSHEGVA